MMIELFIKFQPLSYMLALMIALLICMLIFFFYALGRYQISRFRAKQ